MLSPGIPSSFPGRCQADSGSPLGIVGERNTNTESGTKTGALWLKSDGSCGPTAKRWKRESEQQRSHAGMVGRSARNTAMLTLTWRSLTLP